MATPEVFSCAWAWSRYRQIKGRVLGDTCVVTRLPDSAAGEWPASDVADAITDLVERRPKRRKANPAMRASETKKKNAVIEIEDTAKHVLETFMEELDATDRFKIDVSFWDDVSVQIGEMVAVEKATDDIVATAQTRASGSSSSSSSSSSNTTFSGASSDMRRLRNWGTTPEDVLAEVYEYLGDEGRAAWRFGRKHSGTYLEPINSIGGASLKATCGN